MLTVAAAPPSPFSAFDIPSRRCIVAAVSGGSDSTALLLLLRDHLAAAAPKTRLLAATVDHGLRAESAAEAEAVAALCASLGIKHRTLTWSGEKPATGVPAAAREARYRLLADAARDAGTDLVFTGHTADDQFETVAMRRERRGDGRGLAGMAPATLYAGDVWICRPLLDTRREALRAYLRGRNVGWIDDPTNTDATYERPRMREAIAATADLKGDGIRLAEIAEAGAEREALGLRATQLIDSCASLDSSEGVLLSPEFLATGESVSHKHSLTASLTAALPPGSAPLPHLRQGRGAPIAEAALLARTEWGRGGSGEARDGEGGFRPLEKEAAIYALRLLLATVGGNEHLPDHERSTALFARLGERGLRATLSRCVIERRKDGIRIRRERRGNTPAPGEVHPTVAPFARFLPSFDLAPAAALAALVGAPPLPPPPFS